MNARPSRAAGHAGGFTLLEVLIAVVLLAMLTVVLFSGLHLGTRASEAIHQRLAHASQIGVVYDFLQNELANAQNFGRPARQEGALPGFKGNAQALSFVTTPPDYLTSGGFELLHLRIEPEGGYGRLMVSWTPVLRGAGIARRASLQPSVLLNKVKRIAFAYYGVLGPNQRAAWHNAWVKSTDLPELVRLRVTLADGWQSPDLIVALHLAAAVRDTP